MLQCLLNADWTVELRNVLKHELSPILLSSTNTEGEMHSINKAELISVLMKRIETVTELPRCDMKTCLLIKGHALFQTIIFHIILEITLHELTLCLITIWVGENLLPEQSDKTWSLFRRCSTPSHLEQVYLYRWKQSTQGKFPLWNAHLEYQRSSKRIWESNLRWIHGL